MRVALSGLGLAVTFLPRSAELWIGTRLGRLLLHVDPKRRRIAQDNIRRCLPELGPQGWERLLRQNYEHYGILALEIAHMLSPVPGHYRAYTLRVAVLEGFENWKAAHDKGRGVLFVSAHLANWELMAGRGAMRGIPITIVTRHLKPEWLHRKIIAARREVDCGCLYTSRTAPQVLKALRRGESVGFVMDQYAAPPMGVPVPFFGIKVDTLAAVGTFASRSGAAIIPVLQRRDARGVVHVVIEPELDLGAGLRDPVKCTEALASRIEAWVRANPSQWLWVHRRFKNVVWPMEPASAS